MNNYKNKYFLSVAQISRINKLNYNLANILTYNELRAYCKSLFVYFTFVCLLPQDPSILINLNTIKSFF